MLLQFSNKHWAPKFRFSMSNDQTNHVTENNVQNANIQDGLSAEELFANRDGLTYK